MNTADLARVILREMTANANRGVHEVLESEMSYIGATAGEFNDMVDELIDAGYLRSTVNATTRKPALVLTDKGYGTYQEIEDRRSQKLSC